MRSWLGRRGGSAVADGTVPPSPRNAGVGRYCDEAAAALGVVFPAWTERDCICAWMAPIVSEEEMAKNQPVYARLKAQPRMPGYWMRSLPDEMLRFSHAWAVGGARSATGKPLLECDPWADGRTRPAPLSRGKVEAIIVSPHLVRTER